MKYSATDKMMHELEKLKERKRLASAELQKAIEANNAKGMKKARAKIMAIQWEIDNCL